MRPVQLGLVLLVVALWLPGCAEPSGEPTATPQTPTATVRESTSPTTPEPTTPVPTTTVPTTGAAGRPLRSALLPAHLLPALNATTPWRKAARQGGQTVSVCQKVSLSSIGATDVGRRDYGSTSPHVTATHLVAAFPDELTAQYGFDILSAWLRQCEERLRQHGYPRHNVPAAYTPLQQGDRSGWAVLPYGPVPGEQHAAYLQAEALVLAGEHLSWVVQRLVGQDFNYEVGQSPPELAAPLMADRLSALPAAA